MIEVRVDKRINPDLKVKQGEQFIDVRGHLRTLPVGVTFTKERQPTPEAKSKGRQAFCDRRRLAQDMLDVLAANGTMNKGLNLIDKEVEAGNATNFVKVLPIITPKNVDLTSNGERVMMGTVVLDGEEYDIDLGEDIKES